MPHIQPDDPARSKISFRFAASDAFFIVFLIFSVVRTLRHAMWRDELQTFQLATNSRTLLDLLHNLRYEPHGALWDGLVWGIAQVAHDPASIQVLHATIAAALWIVIWRFSPFTLPERLLLLLSYSLSFEYFVVSRCYGLAVLFAFAFAALRRHRPMPVVFCWLLLGLMANVAAHATIWSIALAIVFALEERRRDPLFIVGGAIYLMLLAFGIATMIPAPDFGPWTASPGFDLGSMNNALTVMLGAFVPLDPGWLHAAAAFLAEPQTAPVPFIWNPNPISGILAITHADGDHPARLAALLIIPVALCAMLTRNSYRVLEFTLAYAGIMLFAVLWHYAGGARHHGLIFLALVACVWTARPREALSASRLFVGLLAVNALGGVLMLSSEVTTFSQSRNAAAWIERSGLAGMQLIGSRDAQVSSVAGYLGRPIYYLECECKGTFVVWNGSRKSPLSAEQFRERLMRALDHFERREAILIRNAPLALDAKEQEQFGVSVELLQSFTGATTDENYWIYRTSRT